MLSCFFLLSLLTFPSRFLSLHYLHTSCVRLEKLLSLSLPQFPQLKSGIIATTSKGGFMLAWIFIVILKQFYIVFICI